MTVTSLATAEVSRRARSLAGALEPVAGQVYFAEECHANYEALGFAPSPGSFAGVAGPEMLAYFCSRGSVMGQVPGPVVAAAFGVFKHGPVTDAVTAGWEITDAATICAARDDGAIAALGRMLGEAPVGVDDARTLLARADDACEPYGKPLYAGQSALERFDDALADSWRLADRLREFRGDVHTAAWVSAGLDACQIGLLSELSWGLPARSYSRTRMWSDADYGTAEAELAGRGWMADGALTDEGRRARAAIETTTDLGCIPIVEALGDDLDRLVQILQPWGATIRDAKGYPASGPHDLADGLG